MKFLGQRSRTLLALFALSASACATASGPHSGGTGSHTDSGTGVDDSSGGDGAPTTSTAPADAAGSDALATDSSLGDDASRADADDAGSTDSALDAASETAADASGSDASASDSAASDASATDTGAVDSGSPDTGTADSAASDAVSSDGGGTCVVLEDFESGAFSASWTVGGSGTAPTFSSAAAHDGTMGCTDTGSFYYRLSPTIGRAGDRITAWIRTSTTGTGGRAYLGFGATATGAKSFVVAQNTGDIRFQDNAGWSYTELNHTPQTYLNSHWYKAEIVLSGTASVTGNLYDSDGVTLLNSVSQTYTGGVTPGGVSIRTFSGIYVDTISYCAGP